MAPLIHKACLYGEMDTMIDLIEVKGIDPCLVNEVSITILYYCTCLLTTYFL